MVANIKTPHPVKVTDSNATAYSTLKVYNRTTGDSETTRYTESGYTLYNLANLGTYTTGDVIEFTTLGKSEGSNTYTVSGGSGTVTITSATTAGTGVTI